MMVNMFKWLMGILLGTLVPKDFINFCESTIAESRMYHDVLKRILKLRVRHYGYV